MTMQSTSTMPSPHSAQLHSLKDLILPSSAPTGARWMENSRYTKRVNYRSSAGIDSCHAVCNYSNMDLSTYIKTLGDETAATILGISIRSARAYRLKDRTPRPEKAREMVKRSKGKLTLERIYG